jgi:hypothetical protein
LRRKKLLGAEKTGGTRIEKEAFII